jgi:hypothetical protein
MSVLLYAGITSGDAVMLELAAAEMAQAAALFVALEKEVEVLKVKGAESSVIQLKDNARWVCRTLGGMAHGGVGCDGCWEGVANRPAPAKLDQRPDINPAMCCQSAQAVHGDCTYVRSMHAMRDIHTHLPTASICACPQDTCLCYAPQLILCCDVSCVQARRSCSAGA